MEGANLSSTTDESRVQLISLSSFEYKLVSLEYSWGAAGFGEKGKKGTFVWGGPASCHDNGPGAAPQVRLPAPAPCY